MPGDHTLPQLLDGIASPDPDVRDGWALDGLADGVVEGRWSEPERERIATTCLERLADPRAEVRSFAALVLSVLVEAGYGSRAWAGPATSWWLTETDERGWDDGLGWVHAVAHGADLMAALGRAGLASPAGLLDAVAARALTPVEQPWRDGEEDRLARAAILLLTSTSIDEATAARWLDPVAEAVGAGSGDRLPAATLNAVRMLRSLVLALEGELLDGDAVLEVPHRVVVRERARAICAGLTTWFWRPAPA